MVAFKSALLDQHDIVHELQPILRSRAAYRCVFIGCALFKAKLSVADARAIVSRQELTEQACACANTQIPQTYLFDYRHGAAFCSVQRGADNSENTNAHTHIHTQTRT